jgi:hypothetical protein
MSVRYNQWLTEEIRNVFDADLDVTDRDAVLDRLHNDPVARYFYEIGKAEARSTWTFHREGGCP